MTAHSTPERGGSAARLVLPTALALLVAAFVLLDPLDLRGHRALSHALVERGRVAVVQWPSALSISAQGAVLVDAATLPAVSRALAGSDEGALVRALVETGTDCLLLSPEGAGASATLRDRLARYEPVEGLRGLHLSPTDALYALDPIAVLPEREREALAVVARRMLGGAPAPRLQSFPESLRSVQSVEVMVLLREGERSRLWRSARGSSLARALLTAAEVARERWHERAAAMGGPLPPLLPRLTVEVALLIDDGTVETTDPAFIDRAFHEQHGVGYERKGAWRYLLPEATADAGKGRASRAYRKLFRDDGLPEASFDRHELRFYRLRMRSLAVSLPAPPADDGLDAPRTPDEILAPPSSQ